MINPGMPSLIHEIIPGKINRFPGRNLDFCLLFWIFLLMLVVVPSVATAACPAGCECLTTSQAIAQWGDGNFTICGTDACGYITTLKAYIPQYCYRESSPGPAGSTASSSTPPTAAFTAEPYPGGAPREILFDGSPSFDAEGISWYYWDFGDNSGEFYSNSPRYAHTYASAGTYTVGLRVVDGETPPRSATSYQSVAVLDPEKPVAPLLPTADFTASVTSGTAPLTVRFTDRSENARSWSWDFGDGTSSTEQNPSHTYAADGCYSITVIASNENGSAEEKRTGYIRVAPGSTIEPVPAFIPEWNDSSTPDNDPGITQYPGTAEADSITAPREQSIIDAMVKFFTGLFSPRPAAEPVTPCEDCADILHGDQVQYIPADLAVYIDARPRIRAQMAFEVDEGAWLFYDDWPDEWKERLHEFYTAYENDEPLSLEDPLPLASPYIRAYRNANLARDVYLAQVAHVLWLDNARIVPWRLEDWSDNEMSCLLSSKVLFSARENLWEDVFNNEPVYYEPVFANTDASYNILGDPRIPFQFMESEPEEGKSLLASTPEETCMALSEWFHDYLWHSTGEMRTSGEVNVFFYDHPLLEDRLERYDIPPYGEVYVVIGCWDASALFADLARSVNIPVKKVVNNIENPGGTIEQHSGLIYDWQGGSGTGRYLIHTDNLYFQDFHYFKDPSPAPKGTSRGAALWDHVWLDPTSFGQYFSYSTEPGIFGETTFKQDCKYWEMETLLIASSSAIDSIRYSSRDNYITFLKNQRGLTEQEAEQCWKAVESAVLSYGDGDRELGFERLLDDPDSRHGEWCARTGKCEDYY